MKNHRTRVTDVSQIWKAKVAADAGTSCLCQPRGTEPNRTDPILVAISGICNLISSVGQSRETGPILESPGT